MRSLFPLRLGSIWARCVRCPLEGTGPFGPYRTRSPRLGLAGRSGAAAAVSLACRPAGENRPRRRTSLTGGSGGAEDAEAFAFGGGGLAAVEGDEFQGGGLVLGGDEGGADVEGVRGAKGVSADDALGVASDDVGRGHLGPALPGFEEVPPHERQLAGGGGLVATA